MSSSPLCVREDVREGGREVCLGGGNIEEERGYSPGKVTSRVCIRGAQKKKGVGLASSGRGVSVSPGYLYEKRRRAGEKGQEEAWAVVWEVTGLAVGEMVYVWQIVHELS